MKKSFEVGQEARLTKRFSHEDVELFARLSLDCNPVHLKDEYAQKTIFGRRIVHGFLTGSLISAVIGTQLPGQGAIYLHQELNFRKPVYLDEELTAIVVITGIKPEKGLLYLDTRCVKGNDEVAIDGNAIVKFINED